MRVTAEHVKELDSLYGECVLVPMPCEYPPAGSLWVIGTGNKHYEGARTVYATSTQVEELAQEEDYNADGELTELAADRIADQINAEGRSGAQAWAYTMQYSDGFSKHVMDQMKGE